MSTPNLHTPCKHCHKGGARLVGIQVELDQSKTLFFLCGACDSVTKIENGQGALYARIDADADREAARAEYLADCGYFGADR